MKSKKFYIISGFNYSFPQKLHETDGLNVERVLKFVSSEYECISLTLDELASNLMAGGVECKGNLFFFCSSQIKNYKDAIVDLVFEVAARGGILTPSVEFYISHDNKYYQELYKARVNVPTPKSKLLTHYSNSQNINVNLPAVVKHYAGFASKGVSLAKTQNELISSVKRNMISYIFQNGEIYEVLRNFIKKYIRYPDFYPERFGRVVLQSFIPDLKHDWKVLVFSDRTFALKRYTRKGDFRASGSGAFDYECDVPESLIKFANAVKRQLNTPFVSLDIAESQDGFSIIEYQSVHFGLATMINAKKYFSCIDDSVEEKVVSSIDVEEIFAKSLLEFSKKLLREPSERSFDNA